MVIKIFRYPHSRIKVSSGVHILEALLLGVFLVSGSLAGWSCAYATSAGSEASGTTSPSSAYQEPSLCLRFGDPNAPVRIVEYSSLTCGHCAEHHKKVMPQLRQEFIDKGKLRYLVVEYPLETVGLELAQVIFAQPEAQRASLRSGLMHNQMSWLLKNNPRDKALDLLRLAGITDDKVKGALADAGLKKVLLQQRLDAGKDVNVTVNATPTFIILTPGQAPVVLEGYNPPGKFIAAVQQALAQVAPTPR